jgi:SAM-dependent methyltransferase
MAFRFRLSHALFSSFDVDDGTRLLLKSIAARVDMAGVRSVLDVGCGVGVLGICVGAHAPTADVLLRDRDALAAALAAENAAANRLPRAATGVALGLRGLGERGFDLILCNVPAKAGAPVIGSLFQEAAAHLAPEGMAAFVIVEPLAELGLSAAAAAALETSWTERGGRYLVLHLRRAPSAAPAPIPPDISAYIRGKGSWTCEETTWEAETAFSLPDFDTLGYSILSALPVLSDAAVKGEVLVWNPGQGHIPVFLARRRGRWLKGISLASRDALELAISERNLRSCGMAPLAVGALPTEESLARARPPGSVDLLCAVPHPVPRVPWQEDLLASARALLSPRGRLLVTTTSTEAQRLLAVRGGFRLAAGRKHLGFRTVLLERQ